MSITIDHRALHIIADGLSRLQDRIEEGYDPTVIYEGVFPATDPLRDKEQYAERLEAVLQAANDAIAASGTDSTVAITVAD